MSCVVAHLNDNFDRDFPRFPRPDYSRIYLLYLSLVRDCQFGVSPVNCSDLSGIHMNKLNFNIYPILMWWPFLWCSMFAKNCLMVYLNTEIVSGVHWAKSRSSRPRVKSARVKSAQVNSVGTSLSFFLSIDTESIKFRSSSQVWWVAKF